MKIGGWSSTKLGMASVASLACLAGGCVTIGNGPYGVPVDAANRPAATAAPPPLLISASEVTGYSTAYLGLVEVTFENRTSVWKQVDHVSVDFGSAAKNQSVTIASGDDIDAWERAITIRNALYRPNVPPLTGIEAVGPLDKLGAWVGRIHHAPPAEGGPLPVGPDASTIPPPSYPDQHLLTTPFRIPPGLFAKRWILLTTTDDPPGGCVDSMIVSYETGDHATGRVRLQFKSTWTEWQQKACYVATAPSYEFGH